MTNLCHCTHNDDPIESETEYVNGLTYLVLRCPRCHRVCGARLVRRSEPRWAALQP